MDIEKSFFFSEINGVGCSLEAHSVCVVYKIYWQAKQPNGIMSIESGILRRISKYTHTHTIFEGSKIFCSSCSNCSLLYYVGNEFRGRTSWTL